MLTEECFSNFVLGHTSKYCYIGDDCVQSANPQMSVRRDSYVVPIVVPTHGELHVAAACSSLAIAVVACKQPREVTSLQVAR